MKAFVQRKMLTIVGLCSVAVLIAVAAVLVATLGTSPAPPGPRSSGEPSASPSASPPTATVQVYFHKHPADQIAAVSRSVPASADQPAAALSQLLAGPTAAERQSGYFSWFSAETAGMLRSIQLAHGVATADFGDFRLIIPNASSSAGSQLLLDELDATLRQFGGVRSTVYSFNGNVAAFYEWLQRVPPGGQPAGPGPAGAAARNFLAKVAGMRGVGQAVTRTIAPGIAEVDLRSDSGSGPVTTVSLQREGAYWAPFAVRTASIRLSEPAAWQAISSPVTVAGRSVTFEGQLRVSVVLLAGGAATEQGRNDAIIGGSTGMRPFSGQVSFTQPAGGQAWLVVTTQSAKTGAIACATAVPVTFAGLAAPPRIDSVRVTSAQPVENGWLTLPAGPGTATIVVRASGAEHVQVYLTPTGTNTARYATLIGGGAPVNGQFTLAWHYPDQSLSAHLSVLVAGPGGSKVEYPFNVIHP